MNSSLRWLRHPTVSTTLVIAGVYLLLQAWTWVQVDRKIPDGVARALEAGPRPVVIVLPFQPEAFHMTFIQKHAGVARVVGTGVHLRRVSLADLRRVVRPFWVVRARLLEEGDPR